MEIPRDGPAAAQPTSGPRPSAASCAPPLPVGLVHDDADDIVIDPDAEVQAAIPGRVRRVHRVRIGLRGRRPRFAGRRFPLRAYGGAWAGQLRWGKLTHARVLGVLKNPCYAEPTCRPVLIAAQRRAGRHGAHRLVERPRTEWPVLIKGHHEGYLTWADYWPARPGWRPTGPTPAPARRGKAARCARASSPAGRAASRCHQLPHRPAARL